MDRRWSVVAGLLLIGAACTGGSTPVPIPASTPSPIPAMHAGGLTFADASGIMLLGSGAGHQRQLVSGNVIAFDWSPDGTELAYMLAARSPSGVPTCSLWMLEVGSGRSSRLASCGGKPFAYGQLIDWASEGTRIHFVSGGTIHVIAPDGTGERDLGTGGLSEGGTGGIGVSSPDGGTIAVLRDPRDPGAPCCGDPYVLQVWLMRPDGSQQTKLAQQGGCCLGARPTMCWSADGSRISLTGVHFQVIDVATGASRIADRPGMDFSVCPSWRPVR